MTTTALKARKEFGKTLASDIAHRLRNEIVTCQLKPDESLKFDALRLSFGASFSTLREALTLLAAEGLVVAEEQRGYKVAPVTLDDLSDLTHARILIEVDLIHRSIESGDDDWEIRVISSLHRLAKIEESKRLSYRGVFAPAERYDAGDYVTHGGSLWCCLRDTYDQPGRSASWRLAAKG